MGRWSGWLCRLPICAETPVRQPSACCAATRYPYSETSSAADLPLPTRNWPPSGRFVSEVLSQSWRAAPFHQTRWWLRTPQRAWRWCSTRSAMGAPRWDAREVWGGRAPALGLLQGHVPSTGVIESFLLRLIGLAPAGGEFRGHPPATRRPPPACPRHPHGKRPSARLNGAPAEKDADIANR